MVLRPWTARSIKDMGPPCNVMNSRKLNALTGSGEVEINMRDRSGSGMYFNSSLLPTYLKRFSSYRRAAGAESEAVCVLWG